MLELTFISKKCSIFKKVIDWHIEHFILHVWRFRINYCTIERKWNSPYICIKFDPPKVGNLHCFLPKNIDETLPKQPLWEIPPLRPVTYAFINALPISCMAEHGRFPPFCKPGKLSKTDLSILGFFGSLFSRKIHHPWRHLLPQYHRIFFGDHLHQIQITPSSARVLDSHIGLPACRVMAVSRFP